MPDALLRDEDVVSRFPEHRLVSGNEPTMLRTGESVMLKMNHATRRPRQLMKSGQFDENFLGETYGAPNDFLGWYFSSEYMIGDDAEYVGRRGEVLPFYVRFDNPLVVDVDKYPFIENKEVSQKVDAMRRKGGHDGIIAVITGTNRIGKFVPPDKRIKELYIEALDGTGDAYAKLSEKEQRLVEKQDEMLQDWMEGKSPESGSAILSKARNAVRLIDAVVPEFSRVTSLVERRRPTGDKGIAAKTWWAIVPPDNINQIKSAELITYDKRGKQIPPGKRLDFANRDFRYGIAASALAAGAVASEEE
jgi:hypothetical protein